MFFTANFGLHAWKKSHIGSFSTISIMYIATTSVKGTHPFSTQLFDIWFSVLIMPSSYLMKVDLHAAFLFLTSVPSLWPVWSFVCWNHSYSTLVSILSSAYSPSHLPVQPLCMLLYLALSQLAVVFLSFIRQLSSQPRKLATWPFLLFTVLSPFLSLINFSSNFLLFFFPFFLFCVPVNFGLICLEIIQLAKYETTTTEVHLKQFSRKNLPSLMNAYTGRCCSLIVHAHAQVPILCDHAWKPFII